MLERNKAGKDLWEMLFRYPSFNRRFWFTLLIVIVIFLGLACLLLKNVDTSTDRIATLNLIIQSATLVLGIFAAYYALRQLVETRFNGLDEAAMVELQNGHYLRAFQKWREAFYIRSEPGVFTNMCETVLLLGDYKKFDDLMRLSGKIGFAKKELLQESSEQIIVLYLKTIRHLLVKNQGEAERYIKDIVQIVKKDGLQSFRWNFADLVRSRAYLDLIGECKDIAENLIAYLSENIHPIRKNDFEQGKFSTQAQESTVQEPTKSEAPPTVIT
jgi:hypothetical protein